MEKRIHCKALAKNIIAVAVEGSCNDWSAYIGVVAGNRHSEEWQDVAQNGDKLPEEIAKAMFPDFDDLEWRD